MSPSQRVLLTVYLPLWVHMTPECRHIAEKQQTEQTMCHRQDRSHFWALFIHLAVCRFYVHVQQLTCCYVTAHVCFWVHVCIHMCLSEKAVNLQREATTISIFLYNPLTLVPGIEKEQGRDLQSPTGPSFNRHVFSLYFGPITALDTRNISVNKIEAYKDHILYYNITNKTVFSLSLSKHTSNIPKSLAQCINYFIISQ